MRFKIRVGAYKIGDEIGKTKDFIVTGFGREWNETVTDDTACAWGLEPGLEYYPNVSVSYAYAEDKKDFLARQELIDACS